MSTKSLLYAAITLGACMTFSSTAMADPPEQTDHYSECSSDADCSSGWTCEQGPTVTVCSGTTDGDGGGDESCDEYQESGQEDPGPPFSSKHRVDDHPTPIEELARVYAIHKKVFPPPPSPRLKHKDSPAPNKP